MDRLLLFSSFVHTIMLFIPMEAHFIHYGFMGNYKAFRGEKSMRWNKLLPDTPLKQGKNHMTHESDYQSISGMTDNYAKRLYQELFT